MSAKTILGALLALIAVSFVAFNLPQSSRFIAPPQEQSAAPAATSSPGSATASSSRLATSTSPGQAGIAFTVDAQHYTANVADGATVLEAMRSLATEGLVFTGREYPSLGFFVESINDKRNADGYYWILYVNGTSSETGASQTVLFSGDTVEWRYEQGY